MKRSVLFAVFSAATSLPSLAQGLYYTGTEAQESLPLRWVAGANVVYDDNVAPGFGTPQDSFAINPSVGMSFVHNTPRTTWDVFARLGIIYYLDAPAGLDDINQQSRVGVNMVHRANDRLRFVSRNIVSYELEPDYSMGFASARLAQEYILWNLDNSVGYRWTQRFGTYTGLRLQGMQFDDQNVVAVNNPIFNNMGANMDRNIWEAYQQFRYQLTPQTVLTADYRYGVTDAGGFAGDSVDQFFLVGAEHRFNPNSIGIIRVGSQLRSVDQGEDASSPYLEFAFNSRVTESFTARAFARYGLELFDSVAALNGLLYNFDQRETLRVGLSSDYRLSQKLSLFSGIDYIPTTYASGRRVGPGTGPAFVADQEEVLFNAFLGLTVQFTDQLSGNVIYNFTNSDSDLQLRSYDRNRISVGLNAQF